MAFPTFLGGPRSPYLRRPGAPPQVTPENPQEGQLEAALEQAAVGAALTPDMLAQAGAAAVDFAAPGAGDLRGAYERKAAPIVGGLRKRYEEASERAGPLGIAAEIATPGPAELGMLGKGAMTLAGVAPIGLPAWQRAGRKLAGIADDMGTMGTRQFVGRYTTENLPKRGIKVTKRGEIVGAPAHVRTAEDVERQAHEYVGRVREARAAGVKRGYSYKEGRKQTAALTGGDPEQSRDFAAGFAVTSANTSVSQNLGHTIRGMEQKATGRPIRTGQFPRKMGEDLTKVMAKTPPDPGDLDRLGPKRGRYGVSNWLDTRDLHRPAAIDIHEMRSFGFESDRPTEAQMRYVDSVRERALHVHNSWHLEPGEAPWSIEEMQELNWAVQRSRTEGISVAEAAQANIKDEMKKFVVNHSWETMPGAPGFQPHGSMADYTKQLEDVVLTEGGRDRFVDVMGGMQVPALRGTPAMYKGQASPYGYQSQSLGYVTQAGGMDPATFERVRGTELMRGYATGQEAVGAGMAIPTPPTGLKTLPEVEPSSTTQAGRRGAMAYEQGSPMTQEQMTQLQAIPDVANWNAVPIPTATGARVLMSEGGEGAIPALNQVLGEGRMVESGGLFENVPGWGDRTATSSLLRNLSPEQQKRADSPQARKLMGEIAQLYAQNRALGGQYPRGMIETLRAWSTGGLPAVRKLVRAGIAPAAVLGFFGVSEDGGMAPSS